MALSAPIRLRCEYRENPLGVEERSPRFSWWAQDDRQNAKQSAWQVRVGIQPAHADLWDSGKQAGGDCSNIAYGGRPLSMNERAYWQVRTWDADGQPSPWSGSAYWQAGLIDRTNWIGQWITTQEQEHAIPGPAVYLRTLFHIANRSVARATLHVTARGVYIPYINGQRVGEDRLTPGWSDYNIRIRYNTYDVTTFLCQNANVIGAVLSDGWYAGHIFMEGRHRMYGDRPWLLAQLHIDYADGTKQVIATDGGWHYSIDGPIVSTSFLHGDTIDARKDQRDWCMPLGMHRPWQPVRDEPLDKAVVLESYVGEPVRCQDLLKPRDRWKLADGRWIFDLGQNMVGVVRLQIQGRPAQVITVRHAEMLADNRERTLYTENLRTARATDTFILSGQGVEIFEPPFTLHGFRYVEVSGLDAEPTGDLITGVVYHSAMPVTGTFECSDPRINQLQSNIVWGQKGNFVEVPTDCPQRDERLGWLGDAQVFAPTAVCNFDVAAFFARWMVDVCDVQRADGAMAHVAPNYFGDNPDAYGSPAWGDAIILCPWAMYQAYGDIRILERCFPAMCRFMNYIVARCEQYIYPDAGYGDWLAIGSKTPRALIGTAYSAGSIHTLARIARVLNDQATVSTCSSHFAKFKEAFNREFVMPSGQLQEPSQTACLLALAFDLLDGNARNRAIAFLCNDIETRGVLTTGFVSINLLLPTLSHIDRDDLAFRLLMNEEFPSWLFSIRHGATTIWERWDGWTPDRGFQEPIMNSFNHYAYGSCGQWLYSHVGGIRLDPSSPGYRHIIIQPAMGGGLTWARTKLDTMHGVVETYWQTNPEYFDLTVKIPLNMTAVVKIRQSKATRIPATSDTQISVGIHRFRMAR